MTFSRYIHQVTAVLDRALATYRQHAIPLDQAFMQILELMDKVRQHDNRVILMSNSGRAAVVGHIATELWKHAGIKATFLSEDSMLCRTDSDGSAVDAFTKSIELLANEHDLIIAIGGSGCSQNITNGLREAKRQGCETITFSGFAPNNHLREVGDLNLYLPSPENGWVEIGHTLILSYLFNIFITTKGHTKRHPSSTPI